MRILVTLVALVSLAGGACAPQPAAPAASPPTVRCPAIDETASRVMAWSAEERAALRAACDRIPTLRQGRTTIAVVDADGRPVPGATVRIEQQRHRFPFGSHPNEVARGVLSPGEQTVYDERFFALFNQVIWGMPWRGLEPTPGALRLEGPERGMQYAARVGASVRGHALIYVQENPPWFSALTDPAQQRRAAEARVRDVIGRYRTRVASWVVVNEAKNTFALDRMRRGRELFEPLPPAVVRDIAAYADDAFRWARESDPAAARALYWGRKSCTTVTSRTCRLSGSNTRIFT